MSQATTIEQSRAIAEVMAAVEVAQRKPRDIVAALAEMRRACASTALAEKAFYSMPRAGGTVAGPSIHLARELARCWGNIDYGIKELARDDERGMSEMIATAWDLQRNHRVSSSFLVPHKRDKKGGPVKLTELSAIYENNANNGARRVRECIFAVLPTDFVEEAKAACMATLEPADPEELARRAETAVAQFARGGITLAQLEEKVGAARDKWTPTDVAELGVLFQSLKRKEITREEAFPQPRVTAAEITGKAVESNFDDEAWLAGQSGGES